MATTAEPRSKPLTPESRFVFLPMDEIVRFLHLAETMDHGDLGREFRAWVRDELAPRVLLRRHADGPN